MSDPDNPEIVRPNETVGETPRDMTAVLEAITWTDASFGSKLSVQHELVEETWPEVWSAHPDDHFGLQRCVSIAERAVVATLLEQAGSTITSQMDLYMGKMREGDPLQRGMSLALLGVLPGVDTMNPLHYIAYMARHPLDVVNAAIELRFSSGNHRVNPTIQDTMTAGATFAQGDPESRIAVVRDRRGLGDGPALFHAGESLDELQRWLFTCYQTLHYPEGFPEDS